MNPITDNEVKRAKEKAVGGKKDRCRKGKNCSATCISGWKACLVQMSSGVSSSLRGAKKLVEGKARQVLPGLRGKYLEGKREQFIKARQKIIIGIKRAALKGDVKREKELKDRLKRLQFEIPYKLKVPYANVSTRQAEGRRIKYTGFKVSLVEELKRLAIEGKKGSYDKIEERLMRLQDKLGGKFGDKEIVAKGKIWKDMGDKRFSKKQLNLNKALGGILKSLEDAAKAGDADKYNKIENKLLKIYKGEVGRKLNLSLTKGSVWKRLAPKGVGIDDSNKAGKKFMEDYRERLNSAFSIWNRRVALEKEIKDRLYDPRTTLKEKLRLRDMLDRVTITGDLANHRSFELMKEIRAKLLKTTLSEDEVKRIIGGIKIDVDGIPSSHPSVKQAKENIEEFTRMFNGKGVRDSGSGTVLKEVSVNDQSRAYAKGNFITTNGTPRITFHEMAHIMENGNPAIKAYAVEWRNGKAFTLDQIRDSKDIDNLVRMPSWQLVPHTMETLSGRSVPVFNLAMMPIHWGQGYRDDEIAVVDKFMNPYMGKVYRHRSTEVISMGVEMFADPQGMRQLYMNHPDLFETIVGLALR